MDSRIERDFCHALRVWGGHTVGVGRGGMAVLSQIAPWSWALRDSEGVFPVLVRVTDVD